MFNVGVSRSFYYPHNSLPIQHQGNKGKVKGRVAQPP